MTVKQIPPGSRLNAFRLIPILFVPLLFPVHAAFGNDECPQILLQRKHASGLTFQVCQADLIDSDECTQRKSEGGSCPPYALAVVVKIINQSETKKMDVDGSLRYDLEDNFQNTYNLIKTTRLHGRAGEKNGGIPSSLYPGDYILEKIYFEPPIAAFQSLTLSLNAASTGIEPPVIPLPIYREMVRQPNHVLPPVSPYMSIINIVSPAPDTEVKPGDVVTLRIKLSERYSRPDTLLVIAPDYTFEDIYHAYRYNIRIPKDWKPGRPYQIAILAKWGRGRDERVASESITLDIVDPKACCRSYDNVPGG